MKKLLLTSMISAALLVGCDKADNKAEEKAVKKVETTQKAAEKVEAKKSSEPLADQAEKAFKDSIVASQSYYKKMVTHPLIESFSYTLTDYQKGKDSSTATTKLSVTLVTEIDSKKSFDLTIKHDIKTDASVEKEGYIAVIESHLQKPEDLLSEQESKQFDEAVKHLEFTTRIRGDQSFAQHLEIKPFKLGEGEGEGKAEFNDNVDFKGLTVDTESTIKNIASGFGKSVIDFKGVVSNELSVEPIAFDFDYKEGGDFTLQTKQALKLVSNGDAIKIASVTGKGNMIYNEKYNLTVGKGTYELKGVEFEVPNSPKPVTLDSVSVNFDNALENDIVAQKGGFTVALPKGFTTEMSQGMLDASEFSMNFAIKDVPASIYNDYQDVMKRLYIDGEDKILEKGKEMFETVKKQGASVNIAFDVKTTLGDVHLDGDIQFIKDSPVTFEEIEKLSQTRDTATLFKLFSLSANANAPASLIEATGMQAMGAMFLQKKGDTYQSVIKTADGQLLINDVPFPL